MSDLNRSLADLARRQHGTFSAQQAIEAGGTRLMLASRARAGWLTKVDADVYRISGFPSSWESTLMGVALAAGPGALISHRAAAALWKLEGFNRAAPEVTIPRGRKFRRDGVRTHESTDLDRSSPRSREGIPVTDPSRTLLDLGRFVGDRRLLLAIESARRLRLASWTELIGVLARHARRGRPGVRRLRRVIAANVHREAITDSDFELLVLALLVEHGLPEPVVHHELRTAGGHLIAEIDLAYPQLRIAIELDGKVHQTDAVFERDRPRQNRIALEGWIILRFTWQTYRDRPDEIVRQVRAALTAARAAH